MIRTLFWRLACPIAQSIDWVYNFQQFIARPKSRHGKRFDRRKKRRKETRSPRIHDPPTPFRANREAEDVGGEDEAKEREEEKAKRL